MDGQFESGQFATNVKPNAPQDSTRLPIGFNEDQIKTINKQKSLKVFTSQIRKL